MANNEENPGRRPLIVGGGIAGTVAAIALREAGWRPLLLESRDAAADSVGAFLTLAVNGIETLASLGVDASKFGGFDTPRFSIQLGNGRELAEIPSGPTRPSGAVSQTIKRADLYRALRQHAEARGVAISYGRKLVDAQHTSGGGVRAVFADGSSEDGAFIIGADGLHSRVRRILDPAAPAPRFLGLLNAGGFARGVAPAGQPGTMHMVFGKRCFFGWVRHPDGGVWWFANPARKRDPDKSELAAIDWRAELLQLFRDDDTPAADIIRATETIFAGWATYDLPRVPRWHDGRMIVVGDAAHAASPSSGQGASMAIEDAVALASCLRDAGGVTPAFEAYERARRARVERMVAYGRRNGTGKTPGLLGRVIRDAVLRLIFRGGRMGDPMGWIYEHRVAWDAPDRSFSATTDAA
jgi:FAD-dependent urate hydroxylase